MNEIRHIPPEESHTIPHWFAHKLELLVDGKEIGSADVKYYGSPFPLYYFRDIYLDEEFRDKRYGKELLSQVNAFLDDRGKPGIVLDNIEIGSPARGMYERNGWVKIEGQKDWYVYNKPENISSDLLRTAVKHLKIKEFDKYEK